MESEESENKQRVATLLFFDTGMPRIALCPEDNSCVENKNILCKHRLKPGTEILYLDDLKFAGFLRLYDFQVLLYFIYLVAFNKTGLALSPNCSYILVTHDRTFLRSARQIWSKRKRKSQKLLKFDKKSVLAKIDRHNSMQMIQVAVITVKIKVKSVETWRRKIISMF